MQNIIVLMFSSYKKSFQKKYNINKCSQMFSSYKKSF